jgi:probable addiction module antidote protein
MTKAKSKAKVTDFDVAQYLDDEVAIANYMTAILEMNDSELLLAALNNIARAKGMAQIAKQTGLGRESLYKALAPGAKPRYETVALVTRALGVKFTAQPA